MSTSLLLLCIFAVALLALVFFSLREARKPWASPDWRAEDECERRHVTFFPQIRQAMATQDYTFLSARGSRKLARRVRNERRAVALAYLMHLRQDFLRLWRLARVIAQLSAQVAYAQELARFRLGLAFSLHYLSIRLGLRLGFAPLPELGTLNEMVSKLAMRMEIAMQELGERAAVAAKLASSLDGRGLDAR